MESFKNIKFVGFPDILKNGIITSWADSKDSLLFSKLKLVIFFNYFDFLNIDLHNFNVLILWEPKAVIPWQYKNNILNKFDLIIPVGKLRGSKFASRNFIEHPYSYVFHEIDKGTRSKDIVMINANKFSAEKSSNYGLRRKVSIELSELPLVYDLYGPDWKVSKIKELRARWGAIRRSVRSVNFPDFHESLSHLFHKYSEYKGLADNKIQILSKYKFNLVIENESDWITEKIYDSIVAETVPLYFGMDLDTYPELNNCAIQLPRNISKINEFIRSLVFNPGLIYEEKLNNIRNLKNNRNFWNKLSYSAISENIVNLIFKNLKSKF